MYYHLVKFPIVYSLSLVIWPLAVLPKPNISCRNTSAYKCAILYVSREKEREKQDGNNTEEMAKRFFAEVEWIA